MLPADYSDGLFQGLVSGRVVKAKAGADETTVDLLFLNKSPWPVEKVTVTVVAASNVLIGMEDTELEFAQPLAPGKSAPLRHAGKATADYLRISGLKPGVLVKGVAFLPE